MPLERAKVIGVFLYLTVMSFRRSLSLESVNSMRSIDTVQSFDSADDVPSMAGGKASSNEPRAEGDCSTLTNVGSVPSVSTQLSHMAHSSDPSGRAGQTSQ